MGLIKANYNYSRNNQHSCIVAAANVQNFFNYGWSSKSYCLWQIQAISAMKQEFAPTKIRLQLKSRVKIL